MEPLARSNRVSNIFPRTIWPVHACFWLHSQITQRNRIALSGHYSQPHCPQHHGKSANGLLQLVLAVSIVMPVTLSTVKMTNVKPMYAILTSALLTEIHRTFVCLPYKESYQGIRYISQAPASPFLSFLPNASSTFYHLCIQGCIPSCSSI